MAEQQEPVRWLVALKIIKPGMDTKEIIARFQAERQALAMMDHPNIARLLDAGTTETGRPYFVMDLVRGMPINEFCDQRLSGSSARYLPVVIAGGCYHNPLCKRSSSRIASQKRFTVCERLELFIRVCQAVQHAHQKGVIHRDLHFLKTGCGQAASFSRRS
jgi:serine/threonine protein kinase